MSIVLSSKYDMNVYMATLLGDEAWDLCWELGWAKSWTQLSTQVPQILLHEIIHIRLNDCQPCFNGFLRLRSWDLASMLGIANMSGTWDLGLGTPCEPALSVTIFPSWSDIFNYVDLFNYLMIHSTLIQMTSHPFKTSMGIISWFPSGCTRVTQSGCVLVPFLN